MKRLMTTTAAALVLGTAAIAQDTATSGFGGVQADPTDFMASDLLGMRIYTSASELPSGDTVNITETDWENIGEINDLIVSQEGTIDGVLVGVGGFLGIGEKSVALSMDNVSIFSGENGERFLVIDASAEELEAAPAFDQSTMEDPADQMAAGDGMATGTDGMATDGMATEPAEGTDMAEGDGTNLTQEAQETETAEAEADAEATADTEMAEGEDAVAEEGAEMEVAEGEGENLTEEAADTEMAETDDAAADEAAAETDMAEGDVATEEGAAETDMAEGEMATEEGAAETDMAEGDMATEEGAAETDMAEGDMATEEGAAETDMAEGTAGGLAAPAVEREGYATTEVAQLTAEDLTGKTVYDINDENLGEVHDLVVAEDGTIDQFIIDVGGFLGLGEKRIAVDFDQVQILSAGEGMSDVRVYIDATEDQLESMEQYNG